MNRGHTVLGLRRLKPDSIREHKEIPDEIQDDDSRDGGMCHSDVVVGLRRRREPANT
jgi:hypothetical protein